MLQFVLMLAATHAVVGAVIAHHFSDHPTVGLIAAFISHPLLDLFPHWDFNSRWAKRSQFRTFLLSALDSGSGMITGLLLFGTHDNLIILAATMLMAQWADFLETPYHFGFDHIPFFRWIKRLQHLWHTKLDWPWGFIPQLLILFFAVWLRFFK